MSSLPAFQKYHLGRDWRFKFPHPQSLYHQPALSSSAQSLLGVASLSKSTVEKSCPWRTRCTISDITDVTRYLQAIFIISSVNFETGIFGRTRQITSRFKDNLDLDLPFGKLVDNFVSKPKLTVRFSKAVFILDPVQFDYSWLTRLIMS